MKLCRVNTALVRDKIPCRLCLASLFICSDRALVLGARRNLLTVVERDECQVRFVEVNTDSES